MARVKDGKEIGRGGGAPGATARDWEGQQDAFIGTEAKKYLAKGSEAFRRMNARNLIANLEDKKSISANKKRERNRSVLHYPNSKYED